MSLKNGCPTLTNASTLRFVSHSQSVTASYRLTRRKHWNRIIRLSTRNGWSYWRGTRFRQRQHVCGMCCYARSVTQLLRMWIALRKDEPNDAWDSLVGAQNSACAAMRDIETVLRT